MSVVVRPMFFLRAGLDTHLYLMERLSNMQNHPKILVWTWTEPDQPSGSPAVLAAILRKIPDGRAEIVCEGNRPVATRRNINLRHPITRLQFHRRVWPFRRGYRIQRFVRYAGALLLVLYGLWRVLRFRPDCLFTIYFNDLWILSSYCLSKLTGLPLILYVHDPYLEAAEHRGGAMARLARWLEPRSLRHGHVLVLYDSLRRHYAERYGIDALVVRHIVTHTRRRYTFRPLVGRVVTIGFAGGIYDNNRLLLQQLAEACKQDHRIYLRIWTNAAPSVLEEVGLGGDRITINFESDYDRLLDGLSKCDLLYLPLAFADTPALPADSLRYVLPTKAVDYLLAGPPILVHCPAEYETSRFFAEYRASYQLNSDVPNALSNWLSDWMEGKYDPIEEECVRRALDAFSPEQNIDRLGEFIRQVCSPGFSERWSEAKELV